MSTYLSSSYPRLVISLTLILSFFSVLFSGDVWAGNQSTSNRQGWPTRRVGGGSRGCVSENTDNHDYLPHLLHGATRVLQLTQQCRPLIALVPEGLAITTQTLPSLWFYLPQVKNSDHTVIEFVLRDEADQLVYEATFKPTHQEDKISSFQLSQSQTFKGLVAGKAYHWYLSVINKAQDRAHDDVVEGWVQRVPISSEIAQQLALATPLEKVQIYQEANLWPEAIALMASLKQMQPNDLRISQMWQQLVTSPELPLQAN